MVRPFSLYDQIKWMLDFKIMYYADIQWYNQIKHQMDLNRVELLKI